MTCNWPPICSDWLHTRAGDELSRILIFVSMENNLNQIKGIVKTQGGDGDYEFTDIIMTKVK